MRMVRSLYHRFVEDPIIGKGVALAVKLSAFHHCHRQRSINLDNDASLTLQI